MAFATPPARAKPTSRQVSAGGDGGERMDGEEPRQSMFPSATATAKAMMTRRALFARRWSMTFRRELILAAGISIRTASHRPKHIRVHHGRDLSGRFLRPSKARRHWEPGRRAAPQQVGGLGFRRLCLVESSSTQNTLELQRPDGLRLRWAFGSRRGERRPGLGKPGTLDAFLQTAVARPRYPRSAPQFAGSWSII